MTFIETHVFTKRVKEKLSDEQYRAVQIELLLRPELGDLIPKCEGLRKSRHGYGAIGKRGGLRLKYYFDKPSKIFYMIYLYSKGEQGDLTPDQKKTLARVVREELK